MRECLDSILVSARGLEARIEVVVSDNASTDDTRELVQTYARTRPWIRYFCNDENVGAERNIHRAASRSRGEYVWVLGDDDRLAPEAVGRFLGETEEGYDHIFCNYSAWTRDFDKVQIPQRFREPGDQVFDDPQRLMRRFGAHLGYVSNQCMKRSVFFTATYDEYVLFAPYGFSFMYALYRGLMPHARSRYVADPLVSCRLGNSDYYDWYQYFVIGTSKVFDALRAHGYSARSVRVGRHQTIRAFALPQILVSKRDGRSLKGVFGLMAPCYRSDWLFWAACVPGLLVPRPLMRLLDTLLLKPKRLRARRMQPHKV